MAETVFQLTPKNYYRVLTGRNTPIRSTSILSGKRGNYSTLTRFWWGFLSGFAPGDILDPIFNTEQNRSRSLSNIMNRSKYASFPIKLRQSIEGELEPDNFLGLVRWLQNQIIADIKPSTLHHIVTDFEIVWSSADPTYAQHKEFFENLRPDEDIVLADSEKDRVHVMIRLAWLGLHAIFGHNMDNPYLAALMQNPECSVEKIWKRIVVTKLEKEQDAPDEIDHGPESSIYPDSIPVQTAIWNALRQYPRPVSADISLRKNDGWYMVANWTDACVAMNDAPIANYRGSSMLAAIPNGSVLYVTMISEYHGLHMTPGVWGYTSYNGKTGFVPVNLLVRIEMADTPNK